MNRILKRKAGNKRLRCLGLAVLLIQFFFISVPVSWAQTNFFSDDFERGDTSAWDALYAYATGTSLSVSTNQAYSGRYSAAVTIPSAEGRAYLEGSFPATNSVYCEAAFYVPTNFSIAPNTWFTFFGPANTTVGMCDQIHLKSLANGSLVCSSYLAGDGSTIVPRGQWNSIETRYSVGTSNGTAAFWVNGIEQQNLTNLTLITPANSVQAGYISSSWLAGTNISGVLYLDNVQAGSGYHGPLATNISLYYPDFRGRTGAPIQVVLTGFAATDRFDVWLGSGTTSNLIYSINPIAGGVFYFPIQIANLPAGTYTMLARLSTTSGSVKAEQTVTFAKNYTGNSRLTIDSNNNLLLDGKPFFPVTSFGAEIINATFWITNHYVNCMFGQGWWLPSTNNMVAYMKLIGTNGMFGPLNMATNYVRNLSLVDDYISTFKNNSNFLGYSWVDEPDYNGYAYSNVWSWYEEAKTRDPVHLVQINLMGTSFGGSLAQQQVGMAWSYPNQVGDIYGFDMYPVYNTNLTFAQMNYAAVNLNKFNRGLIPFFGFVQTCNGSATSAQPTPEQVTMMSWLLVVSGAKGIQWYPYGGYTPPQCYAAMAQFTSDTGKLAPVILSSNIPSAFSWTQVSGASNSLFCVARILGNSEYVFAVNVAATWVTANFYTPGLPAVSGVSIYGIPVTFASENGGFSDTLPPYGVRIYSLAAPGAGGPPPPPDFHKEGP